MSNFKFDSYAFLQRFNCGILVSLMCLVLVACSGGISGTGDGGDVIVDNNGLTDGADSMASENMPVDALAPEIFPPQLIVSINNGLTTIYPADNRFPTQPVTHLISRQLGELSDISVTTQVDIALLETQLLDQIQQCQNTSPCQLTQGNVNAVVTQDTIAYELSLQTDAAADAIRVAGTEESFTNIQYASDLQGYFDKSLKYTRNDGLEVFIRWTNDRQLISTQTSNSAEAFYILSDLRQQTMTLRREDKTTTTVFHAVASNDSDGNTSVEADWHGTEEHYVKAIATATTLTLYSLNPTDSTATRFREALTLPQQSYTIDSCVTSGDTCDTWISVAMDEGNVTNRFSATQDTIGNFSLTLTDAPQPTLADDVREFVISADTNSNQPLPQSLYCAGQRVIETVRTFCWQPLPLEATSAFFEETLTSGGLGYRRLPDATF